MAAQSYPTVSWVSPTETIDVNINSTINIYEAIKKARKYIDPSYDPIVVVACSSAEYGETLNQLEGEGKVYVQETAGLLPLHPYGVSKVGQDLISFQYFMNDHIRCIRARILIQQAHEKSMMLHRISHIAQLKPNEVENMNFVWAIWIPNVQLWINVILLRRCCCWLKMAQQVTCTTYPPNTSIK